MKKVQRRLSFDLLKGIGMFILVISHHIAWLFVDGNVAGMRYPNSLEIFHKVVKVVLTLGLPFWGFFLPLLAGSSIYFYVKKESTTFMHLLRRAIMLVFLGFVMNFFAWGIYDLFAWDVLPFVAICSLVSYPLIKKANQGRDLIILFILGAVCLFGANVFPWKSWQHFYLYKIIIGDIEGFNYWPFFPWFSVFSVGIGIGYIFLKQKEDWIRLMPWVGAGLLLVSFATKTILPVVNLGKFWGPDVFKPSPFYVLGVIGFGLFTIGLLELLFNRFKVFKKNAEKSFFVRWGRAILWIYLFSTVFGYRSTLMIAYFCENIYQALFVLPLVISMNLMISGYIAKLACREKVVQYS